MLKCCSREVHEPQASGRAAKEILIVLHKCLHSLNARPGNSVSLTFNSFFENVQIFLK